MSTTTNPTLVDRYVAAVVSGIPTARRHDVAVDLRAALESSVQDLIAEGVPAAEAEDRAVRALGDPAEWAARHGGHPMHLIGPAFYTQYIRLLRTLAAIVLPIVGLLVLLAEGISGDNPAEVLFGALGATFQVGVQLAFWVTLSFALIERSGAAPKPADWTPADLPRVVDRRIGLGDTVPAITGLTLLIWALLWERTHWLVTASDGNEVPVLDPDLWQFWLPALLMVLVASVLLEIAKYRAGRWDVRLAVVNTVLNAAFAGIVLWMTVTNGLLNPALEVSFPDGVTSLFGGLAWVIVGIAGIDTASGWWNALRDRDARMR